MWLMRPMNECEVGRARKPRTICMLASFTLLNRVIVQQEAAVYLLLIFNEPRGADGDRFKFCTRACLVVVVTAVAAREEAHVSTLLNNEFLPSSLL